MSRNHINLNVNDSVSNSHQNSISTSPQNSKLISNVAISPQTKYVLTYSQEDKSFVGWHANTISEQYDLRIDTESSKWGGISDFKVSDNKIILYNYNGLAKFHDLRNNKDFEIQDEYCEYSHTHFIKNGNIVTFKCNSSTSINPSILVYELTNKNEFAQKAFYIFNEKDIKFGGFISDRMWMITYGLIFLLDLTTFQLQKFSLFEMNLNIEKVKFKFSEKLIIMKVDDEHYIYSKNVELINFPIGRIVDSECQEFEFAGNNDEFIITLSNNNVINIYFWKSNLKGSITLMELLNLDVIIHTEFKDQRLFVVSLEKLHFFNLTKHDWRNSIFKDHMNDFNNDNLFMDIDQKYSSIQDKMKATDEYLEENIPKKFKKTKKTLPSRIDKENRNSFLIASIFFGCFHLLFEVRQFLWNPYRWLLNFWNIIGAYLLPTYTSILWYKNGENNTYLVSTSCLILEMKFILFLRAFEPFGIYFAIMLGNSNYANSLLAMSLFLTGDGSLFNKWSPKDNKIMIALMLLYSFIIVVFLMNLLIGLLNMAIEADNDRVTYLAQKAEILKEIELLYFLPNQKRCWKSLFPELM
ncbi:14947_t:CDS:2 [Funneliformis caledonium]|uniref:14947_t:CDS:1 n=1 Tax=Funneliformis caledonium TaxID=1117310 RepID=A0A9N9B6W1_9GLOM|nr:14947_t:CDS:2 [Funneliformis caledonium]